jgi:hypothetical protein
MLGPKNVQRDSSIFSKTSYRRLQEKCVCSSATPPTTGVVGEDAGKK